MIDWKQEEQNKKREKKVTETNRQKPFQKYSVPVTSSLFGYMHSTTEFKGGVEGHWFSSEQKAKQKKACC